MKTVYNVQVLRALAAFMVVIYHALHNQASAFGSSLAGKPLASGVDIFFVVSGFVMVYVTHERNVKPLEFLRDRILRIYPVYWFVTVLLVLLTLTGLKPVGLHAWDIVDLVSSLLLWPSVRADGQPTPLVSVAWTLIYEMYFYLVFAVGLNIRSGLTRVALIAAWFSVVVATGALLSSTLPFWLSVYSNPVILEFCVGCLLGLAYRQHERGLYSLSRGRALALLLLGAGTLGLACSDLVRLALPNWNRMLFFGLPASCIVAGALLAERCGLALKHRSVLLLGAASYSIYLIHQLLLQIAFKLALRFAALVGPLAIVAAWLISFALIAAVGIGIHLYFERPVTRRLKAALQAPPRAQQPTAEATS